jgi:hypothetical protein
VQVWPGGQVPPQSPNIPPHVNASVVEVVDEVDVVVGSSANVDEVDVELLLVVDGTTVVLVEDVLADELEVELVDELVAPGTVVVVVVGDVLLVDARVVDGRLVVVVAVAG